MVMAAMPLAAENTNAMVSSWHDWVGGRVPDPAPQVVHLVALQIHAAGGTQLLAADEVVDEGVFPSLEVVTHPHVDRVPAAYFGGHRNSSQLRQAGPRERSQVGQVAGARYSA